MTIEGHVARMGMLTQYGGPVTLDDADLALADECARIRLANAQRLRARDRWGQQSYQSDYLGACCEIAFARWAGLGWACREWAFKEGGDVNGFEVRKATLEYGMPVHLEGAHPDPVGRPCVAVIQRSPTEFTLPGWWVIGDEKPEWRRDPGGRRPAHFVPISALRLMRTIPREFPQVLFGH